MFTKQHYKAIAEIVKNHSFHDHFNKLVVDTEEISQKLADYFAADNERFNRDKFLKACGIVEGE